MQPEYIFGPLLAIFLIWRIVARLRGDKDDYSDDTLNSSDDDSNDDA